MDDALVFALGVMCLVTVGIALGLGVLFAVARRGVLARQQELESLARAWGMRPELRRPPEQMSPVAGALMRGALLIGGGRRWVGTHEGREIELVLRGEVGSVSHQHAMAARTRSPVRFDYVHLRVARRRATGFAFASRGKQAHEVVAALGPPSYEDTQGLLWAADVASARALVARWPSSPFAVFVDDAWVVVEQEGVALDVARLDAMRSYVMQVAHSLDG
ncbi:MAG: hypothetical protein H6721_07315 [Sandaracinus sp.]|nr:hypothetical protein [Myxococcales bacterium]MCB9603035.1 hypothetical protein [Sandaracinus sp.]MCB9620072.1 hypothetical protein [Sandaracinus sp.]MCB9631929.1 hypothetical protein [Sandaracinus sp.]